MRVGIYQLIIELAPSMLYSLDNIYRRYGNRVPAELYEKVFEGNIKAETYNDIFDVFNIRHSGSKILESTTLNKIAKKNGYDCCNWSSHESGGQIKVTFKKRKECKCDDEAGKSCNCGIQS